MRLDGRIAVRLVPPGEAAAVAEGATVLIRIGADRDEELPGWAAVRTLSESSIVGHAATCRCCSGRSGVSDMLGLLFQQRARMELPFFTRVVIQLPPDRIHDLVTILCNDDTVASRFQHES